MCIRQRQTSLERVREEEEKNRLNDFNKIFTDTSEIEIIHKTTTNYIVK